ncbi:MAG: CPBP family intramembrane metalloprotease [Candidatus Thorarchaeota archaeon]|nr:CPBP family intramembrane metalloprotease [Candidatus Thorarchaeota archaeon]
MEEILVSQLNDVQPDEIHKVGLTLAWTAMVFASSIAVILWVEFASVMPEWWPLIHGTVLLSLLLVAVAYKPTRSMWRFFSIIVTIFFLGFGGGWRFGLIPWITQSVEWITWVGTLPVPFDSLALHLLRLTPAFAILFFLVVTGRKREDFYLIKGQIDANVEPSRLIGVKEPEPWTKTGKIFAIVFVVFTVVFLVMANQPTVEQLVGGLVLLPVAALIAIMNAFNEEFTLRAAPLSELEPGVGKAQALMITSVYFGLGHFYGIPNGIIGVGLSAFLGYFLGKSMLETKGFFWAWIIHFLPDLFIFYFLLVL